MLKPYSDKLQREQSLCISARHALADIPVTPTAFLFQGDLQLLQLVSGARARHVVTPWKALGTPGPTQPKYPFTKAPSSTPGQSSLPDYTLPHLSLLNTNTGWFHAHRVNLGWRQQVIGFSQPFGVSYIGRRKKALHK